MVVYKIVPGLSKVISKAENRYAEAETKKKL
jgi:hypothetical protein